MERLTTLLLFLFILMTATASDINNVNVYLYDYAIDDSTSIILKNPHKLPHKQVTCEITKNNVIKLYNIEKQVGIFELWNYNEDYCYISTSDELTFSNFIFSLSGNYIIRFICNDYILIGNINL
jgi:hypothetical protein